MKRVYVLSLIVLSGCTAAYAASPAVEKKDDRQASQAAFENELMVRANCSGIKSQWASSSLVRSRSAGSLLGAFETGDGLRVYHRINRPGEKNGFMRESSRSVYSFESMDLDELSLLKKCISEVKCSKDGVGAQLQSYYTAKIATILKAHQRKRDEVATALLQALHQCDIGASLESTKKHIDKHLIYSIEGNDYRLPD